MENMTGKIIGLDEDKHLSDQACPVCGSDYITQIYHGFEDDAAWRECACGECGSEFTFTYWVSNVYVLSDGRFEDKE